MRPPIWRSPNFLKLWSAGTVSDLGSEITELALPLTAILILHATPSEIGVLGAVRAVPYLLIGLAAGVLVDRSRPVPLLVATDLGRSVILASIPIVYATGHLQILQLYVVAFFAGCLTVIFGVARQATIHTIVPRQDLIDANSKMGVSHSVAEATGPGLGGLLIGALSAPVTILIDAVSFLISAALVGSIRAGSAPPQAESIQAAVLADVKEGLHFILRHEVLRRLAMTLALLNLFASVFFTAYLLYAVRVLHLGPSVIGVVLALAGLGGIAGAATATRLGRRFGVGRVIAAGAAPVGLLLIPLAPRAAPIPWLIAGGFTESFALMVFYSTQLGVRQALTPARLQGRMTGSMRFLIQALVPVGSIVGGTLGSTIGLRSTLWVGAIGSLSGVVPILLSRIPAIRAIPEQAEP